MKTRLDDTSWVKLTETDSALNGEVTGALGFDLPADLRVDLAAVLAPLLASPGLSVDSPSSFRLRAIELGRHRPASLIRFLNFNPHCQPAIEDACFGDLRLVADPAGEGRWILGVEVRSEQLAQWQARLTRRLSAFGFSEAASVPKSFIRLATLDVGTRSAEVLAGWGARLPELSRFLGGRCLSLVQVTLFRLDELSNELREYGRFPARVTRDLSRVLKAGELALARNGVLRALKRAG